MNGCDLIVEPREMRFEFRIPEVSVPETITSRYFRHRPKLFSMFEDDILGEKSRHEEESESESEEHFNDNCSACERQKQKKTAHEKKKVNEKKENNQTYEVDTASEARNETFQTVENLQGQKFAIRLNVNGFKPGDMQVKIKDGYIEVNAKSEEKNESDGTYSLRQLSRRFTLPSNVNPDSVTSFLNKDGYLSIEAPSLQPDSTSQQEDGSNAESLTTSSMKSMTDPKDHSITITTGIKKHVHTSEVYSS